MASETDPSLRRVPTLVSYCQRASSAISCLGDDIRYDVIKPVLECCSADTLLRLEQSSPYLEEDTSDLWKRLCFKSYPLLAEQLIQHGNVQSESWREQYFLLQKAEAHRLEEVASKLRSQRMEAAERKKEREVKLTDKLPPTKRARGGWATASQPKTLFQKTKNEATKLRRSMYTSQMIPPMSQGKVHRVLPSPASAKPPAPPSRKPVNNQITVRTVTVRRPSTSMTPQLTSSSTQSTSSAHLTAPVTPNKAVSLSPSSKLPLNSPVHSPPQTTDPRPFKPPIPKKDPMASLFMPKHRALSQLPQTGSNRSVPAR
ncbi:RNA polymerase II transcription factor SIII subunit A-domain-containing protein [Melanogaster broomeanus]|nr:RNA polymerase II transcription factor SIII subunit A-domain-containing protein [Melanogaster broomeanus]